MRASLVIVCLLAIGCGPRNEEREHGAFVTYTVACHTDCNPSCVTPTDVDYSVCADSGSDALFRARSACEELHEQIGCTSLPGCFPVFEGCSCSSSSVEVSNPDPCTPPASFARP